MKIKLFSILIVIVVILNSCASYYRVNVTSIRAKGEIEKKIFISPADPNITLNDLLFQEFAADIVIALEKKGFTIVSNNEDADQIAFLIYGISDPKTNTVTIPQFGKTNIKSSTTTGNMNIYGNQANINETTTYNYDYGITGFSNINNTSYTRMITITSYDWKKYLNTQEMVQLWQTQIMSTGSCSDMRKVFPFLVAASEEYISEDTKKMINTYIYDLDKNISDYQIK